MSGKGRTYELDMARDLISEVNSSKVFVAIPDYSGNAADSCCDLFITWPEHSTGTIIGSLVELKKRSGEEGYRKIVMGGGSDGETGLEELQRLIDGTPSWAHAWVAIKFDHRELVVLHAETLHEALTSCTRNPFGHTMDTTHDVLERLKPRLTDADSISMVKPELEWWPSSAAGEDDHLKLLEHIGVDSRYFDSSGAESQPSGEATA